MKYKNIFFAYGIEIFIGLLTSIAIIIFGTKAFALLAFFAVRPFVLEKEEIKNPTDYLQFSFQLGKNSIIVLSIFIITFSILSEIMTDTAFLFQNKMVVLKLIIPSFILIHGVIGVDSLIRAPKR